MDRREQLTRIVEAVYSAAYPAQENCVRIEKVFRHVVALESEVDPTAEPPPPAPPPAPVHIKSDKSKR